MKIVNNEDCKLINNLIESKIYLLRQNKNFEKKYIKLFDKIEDLENKLTDENKKLFDEVMKLIYETEEYYFALSYSLGVKYGEDLKKI